MFKDNKFNENVRNTNIIRRRKNWFIPIQTCFFIEICTIKTKCWYIFASVFRMLASDESRQI